MTPIPITFSAHCAVDGRVAALAAQPSAPLALGETAQGAEGEASPQRATARRWRGPWAAPGEWLQRHRGIGQRFPSPLVVDSWPAFWADPWAAVDRAPPPVEAARGAPSAFALEQLPVPTAVLVDGAVAACNRAFASLVGRRAEDLRGLALERLWTDPAAAAAFCAGLARGAAPERVPEASWRRGDQREIRVELRWSRLEAGERDAAGWILAAHDVSRHHRAREFLEMQRNLVDCAESGIMVMDVRDPAEPRVVFVNPAWEAMTGYTAEDAIALDPRLLRPREEEQPGARVLDEAVRQGQRAHSTLRLQRRDGAPFWCELAYFPLRQEGGPAQLYVGVLEDVSEKMETQARLVASERRFRHLFADNLLPMLLFRPDTLAIVDANPAALRYYGHEAAALRAMAVWELCAATEPDARALWQEALGPGGGPSGTSHRHRLADGALRDVLVCSDALHHEGEPVHYAIIVDITAQREAERQWQAATAAAKAASLAKADFLQVVGHEIRTPVNAITGFAELLADAADEEERAESVEMIAKGARQLVGVLDQVIDYIRWSSEAPREAPQAMGLDDFIQLVTTPSADAAAAKGLRFVQDGARTLPPVLSFPAAHYGQILERVLDNAIKFTIEGHVQVSWAFEPADQVLEVRIADTGVGMSTAQQARLFEPFASGDEGTRREHEGLGMGLAVCRRMVDAYGGRIAVVSAPDEGSSLTLRLPAEG